MIETPAVFGWTGITDWSIQSQIIVKTQPGAQWSVARILRKSIMNNFKKDHIHLAILNEK
jgi:small-conductance mechanosensitive channel